MKIREAHPVLDRIKLIIILLLLLMFLGNLTQYLEQRNSFKKTATIAQLLETAMHPVGTTMYIWGGGWNDEDDAAGATSTQIGLCSQWLAFAKTQDENYDYTKYRFEREKGLDCSGYVGWVVYNTFEQENGKEGYVTQSTDMAKSFAERGWGTFIENPKEFLPGDIVSMEGHVWICLGTCEDGSVLLVHSSPPGVSVCGTYVPQEKRTEEYVSTSIAIDLAAAFMEENYPQWQKKYPNRAVADFYLKNVSVMRWNSNVMTDAKEMQTLSGEEIIDLISQKQESS